VASRVSIQQGDLEGFLESGVHKFLGVPYARPPVGDLRWRAPQPFPEWGGLRTAKAFGPACPQTAGAVFGMRALEQSEDCLYLNVWTRTLDATARQPVMVWIHGGGNLGGSGCEEPTDGSILATLGVTVVSFNYRLGAFGFLAHPDVGANFGLQDQIAVLQWVHVNIIAFGGDPDQVTIFGQSAGAHNVRTLLRCHLTAGLIHRAILQSAGFEPFAFGTPLTIARARATAEELFSRLGGGTPERLRATPTAAVKLASHELCGVVPVPGQPRTPADLAWMPVEDRDTLLPQEGLGAMDRVPILMGFTRNEARYFLKPGVPFDQRVLEGMCRLFGGAQCDALLAELAAQGGSVYERIDKVFTTAIWAEPASATAHRIAPLNPNLYVYRFDRVSPGLAQTAELAKHTAEIRYIFSTLSPAQAYDAIDRRISTFIQEAWINFARTGTPGAPGGVPWPSYVAADHRARVIDDPFALYPISDDPLVRLMQAARSARQPGLTGRLTEETK
jgi:para-nitrobenzyl esterase